MKDKAKTKEQLLGELKILRTRVAGLERGTSGDQSFDEGTPVRTSHASKLDIPNEMLAKWQRVADLMAKIVGVPAGLIRKVDLPQIEVFIASSMKGNPYEKGERADLNTGLYCEIVMSQRSRLLVPNALKDQDWDHNPDVKLGMISYLGFPLSWPDKEIFGTICVLDAKENRYSEVYVELIARFKELVDTDLNLLCQRHELEEEITQRKQVEEALQKTKDELEVKVEDRTIKLKKSNEQLRQGITQRKQAEEQIKQAAEEWQATFDAITDLVSVHDTDFKILKVNKAYADFFGLKPEEIIGKTCYQLVHGTNKPHLLCPFEKTMMIRKPTMEEFYEPGLGIHLQISTSPTFNEKGDVTGRVHFMKDVTEHKRMEEQLMVTDRLASIGELSSGIAHELNNPLTGIIGFSDLLLGKDVSDDVKEDLRVINREAKRTAGIVRNLLTFARKHPKEKQLVDVNKVIQGVLELRAYEQRVNNIEVNTQFTPDLPEVMSNSFELQQVFLNIIINADHFMIETHGRGNLTITTERVGDIIRAAFADDGPGIAKENLGHLFDPFFTTKEMGKGTGLGLSICHGILTEHGGRIYAESELGKGATFVVELPISK